jgi:hypothetical protein
MDQPDIVILRSLARFLHWRHIHTKRDTTCNFTPPCFARHWVWVFWRRPCRYPGQGADSGRITLAYRESSVPFSYLDNGKPIGMTVDISQRVAEAVKKAVNKPALKVRWQAVTSQNRIRC